MKQSEKGAAAVEFALVVPLLLLLLIGMLEFGRVYNAQIELSGAAREGARTMAVHNDPAAARTATRQSAPALNPAIADSQIAITSGGTPCTVTVTATYPLTFLTGLFGSSITLTGKSTMQCGG